MLKVKNIFLGSRKELEYESGTEQNTDLNYNDLKGSNEETNSIIVS